MIFEDEDLEFTCLSKIHDLIDERGEKLKISGSITKLVKYLWGRYGLNRYALKSHVAYVFWKRGRHLKYDPMKLPLGVYIAWFVRYELLSLKRECDKLLNRERTVPLSEMECDTVHQRAGASIVPYENQGLDGLINNVTPEDELFQKELMNLAEDFFCFDDLAVLVGAKDRHDEAKRLGIDYFTYCKRLNRRVQEFKHSLRDTGYID